jgi:hypothetical protein
MEWAQKIEAVKDTTLNPYLFDDPTDGLANSLYRWAKEAPAFAGKDEGSRAQIANKYYDEALAPLYHKLGVEPLDRNVWLHSAWGTALTYEPSQTYRHPLLKGALEGEDSAISMGLNAARTITNITGTPVVAYADSVKRGDYTGLTGFYNLFMSMHNRVVQEGFVKGVSKTIEAYGEQNPLGLSGWMHGASSDEAFWSTVSPAHGFTEKATSMVVENVMLLPLFEGIGEASKLGIGLVAKSADGIPIIKNLTEVLGASKKGQFASKLLTNGTEGLIFVDLTLDSEHKDEAWKSALGFAAMGTLMSVGGGAAKKLVDHFPDGIEKDAMSAAEREAELGAQGKRSANADEYLAAHRAEIASNIAAGGLPLQHSIYEEALAVRLMAESGEHTKEERVGWLKAQVKDDPDHWKPVFSSATMIRTWLEERNLLLKDLDPKGPQYKELVTFMNKQASQASDEMDIHVPEIKEMKGRELLDGYMKTPGGQKEFQQELEKQNKIYAGQLNAGQKAESVALANLMERHTDAVQKAAESKTITGPVNVQKNQPSKLSIETAAKKTESRYEYDKSGKITGYQMALKFNWVAAANSATKAKSGGRSSNAFWTKYVEDLTANNDDDVAVAHALASDLREYFNPLKEYGLTFEKANTDGGDWTNFLAYMYSYRDKLPGPVAEKLQAVLMNSPKMNQLLGKKTTTAALDEFSQAIQNHVDIFTRSKWYQDFGERHVFRSTQPGVKGTSSLSPWQRDLKLITSAHEKERKMASAFYPGRSKAMLEAKTRYLKTLKGLHDEELAAYKRGSHHSVARITSALRNHIISAGYE